MNNTISKVVYGGNVNADRLHALSNIANCIHAYNNSLVLDVYGDASDEVKAAMEEAPSLAYHDKVPYWELLKVFETTDMLVHVEDFSEYRQLDCAHGFSTKIGDCYRNGVPFFLYGPTSIPCIRFGLGLCPEYTTASPEELKNETRGHPSRENPIHARRKRRQRLLRSRRGRGENRGDD